ncbi:peptide methionine sulfoxide reductase [Gregarina niphandrodes]|uniref:peptide-methionine (S)-S-oxide reductase n=1 Tax=Gregarina niphandrodes TaxID=110365 RepID=A0A023B2K6_GRENI|nr:peptide methionine sulfoxide reductase [Gregarina niphandrodes]EZG55076.1 peptide methionine sulfoxide reductase [Gregarina niphandrodes]|eukprot:XP_011131802.1 peptide methionine sulfoxide reductase [Gregarina niphandrodes]
MLLVSMRMMEKQTMPVFAHMRPLILISTRSWMDLANGNFRRFSLVDGEFDVPDLDGGVAGVVSTYETVDDTDHAEMVHIVYDDDLISLDQLFDAFFLVHDPTQLDRQGEDQGRQYRSAIFVHNAKDLQTAQDAIGRAKKLWEVEGAHIPRTVVTTVQLVPVSDFYRAEDYHQNFAVKNPKNEYCKRVVNEKIRDARKLLRDLMKGNKTGGTGTLEDMAKGRVFS